MTGDPGWLVILVEPLRYPFMVRALLAGVLVAVAGAVTGSFLLVRRWSLLGDAISHAVLPGVAVAYLLGWPYFTGALASALLTAAGIGFLERNTRLKSDAATGLLFLGAFALGLAILSRARSSVDVFHILFGNVLGVSRADLVLMAVVAAVAAGLVVLLFKELQLWAFDPVTAEVAGLPGRALHYLMMVLVSATLVAALQAVGVVLALAMLVTPPATAYLLTRRFPVMILLAVVLGTASAVTGLYLSFYLNVASGPAMVLVAMAGFVVALGLAPEQGLLARALERRRLARVVAAEDVLKALHELGVEGGEALGPDGPQIAQGTAAPRTRVTGPAAALGATGGSGSGGTLGPGGAAGTGVGFGSDVGPDSAGGPGSAAAGREVTAAPRGVPLEVLAGWTGLSRREVQAAVARLVVRGLAVWDPAAGSTAALDGDEPGPLPSHVRLHPPGTRGDAAAPRAGDFGARPAGAPAQPGGGARLASAPATQGVGARPTVAPRTGNQGARLTAAGVREARRLIRTHRLWERYLTDVAGMAWEDVHQVAHELEHATPPHLAEEMAEALGHPARDPHGAPIPTAAGDVPPDQGPPPVALGQLPPGRRAVIVRVDDEDPELLARLRRAGLVPGTRLQVVDRAAGGLWVRTEGGTGSRTAPPEGRHPEGDNGAQPATTPVEEGDRLQSLAAPEQAVNRPQSPATPPEAGGRPQPETTSAEQGRQWLDAAALRALRVHPLAPEGSETEGDDPPGTPPSTWGEKV